MGFLKAKLDRLLTLAKKCRRQNDPVLARLRRDPSAIFQAARLSADPWQTELLRRPSDRVLILASRQVGKSLTAAALALREALLTAGALVLILSRSQRQSSELFRAK